jgi:ABC-type siderophore export system fused ATPase/permease subunit
MAKTNKKVGHDQNIGLRGIHIFGVLLLAFVLVTFNIGRILSTAENKNFSYPRKKRFMTRVARSFLVQHTKMRKHIPNVYQMTT